MTDDSSETQRDNQLDLRRFGPAPGVGRAIQERLSGEGVICEAPECTNPGGAFTSERAGRIYQFCSEGCRARFESAPA